jgi:hypothetical protein
MVVANFSFNKNYTELRIKMQCNAKNINVRTIIKR